MTMDKLVVSGAREHNLKDVSLELAARRAAWSSPACRGRGSPRWRSTPSTPRASGATSSRCRAYARQFLGQMDKPDVDSIEGLSPAISIDQKTTSRNPRSTVGTVTEIYDYLRLLWARVGHPHCHNCGQPIAGQSAEQIIDQVMELPEGTRFMVLAPIVRGRKGEYGKLFEELRADGFARVKVDGELRRLDEKIVLDKKFKHDIAVGRRPARDAAGPAQAAGRLDRDRGGAGRRASWRSRSSTTGRADDRTAGEIAHLQREVRLPGLRARRCRSSSRGSSRSTRPHGACERCTGLGLQMEIDPELVVPDPSLSIGEGALAPWAVSASNYYEQITQALAEQYGVDLDTPWEDLPDDDAGVLPLRHRRRARPGHLPQPVRPRRSYATQFEGIVPNLERRYRETDSDDSREKIEEFMTLRPCPACKGARLRPESRAVLVGGTAIHEFTRCRRGGRSRGSRS